MLTRKELLLLSTLAYAVKRSHFKQSGLTVGMLAQKLGADIKSGVFSPNLASTTKTEWRQIMDLILADHRLSGYRLSNPYLHKGMFCFIARDNHLFPQDVNLIFRGTITDSDWQDNAISSYSADSPLQLAALQRIRHLPLSYGRKITVSGHSKGGNYAQYLAIHSRRVDRAVVFDSMGFSPEFFAKYPYKISNSAYKITNISAAADVVNALLAQIPGTRQIFISTKRQVNPLRYHKPNILLDEQGRFYPIAPKAHTIKAVSKIADKLYASRSIKRRKKLAHGISRQASKLIVERKSK